MLHRQDADSARGSSQGHAQPGSGIGTTLRHLAFFEELLLKFLCEEQRLPRAQNVAAAGESIGDGLGRRNGIAFVHPKLEMDQVGFCVVQTDEAILRVKNFADGTVSQLK